MREERENKRVELLDLGPYMGKSVQISFFGGIQVRGYMRGYDTTMNVVLENARMVKVPDSECPEIEVLCKDTPSSMLCMGSSICSVDVLERL